MDSAAATAAATAATAATAAVDAAYNAAIKTFSAAKRLMRRSSARRRYILQRIVAREQHLYDNASNKIKNKNHQAIYVKYVPERKKDNNLRILRIKLRRAEAAEDVACSAFCKADHALRIANRRLGCIL